MLALRRVAGEAVRVTAQRRCGSGARRHGAATATTGVHAAPRGSRKVNALYEPGVPQMHVDEAKAAQWPAPPRHVDAQALLAKHDAAQWTSDDVRAAADKHTVMTWGATNAMLDAAMWVEHAEDVYVFNAHGKRIQDFNSMAMCANLGHTVPDEIVDAITQQLRTVPYVYPGVAVAPIRARLSALLADLLPGDLNHFLFPSTGMEANETAVRLARLYTGRNKVLTRYRSYHGASSTTMAMTGDQRRWPVEAHATNHVHMMDPWPYSFAWGDTPLDVTRASLQYTRELIEAEGAHTIAAVVIEAVTGTNGLLPPPPGYLRGLRELCTEYGIVLVCDEVMAGFGRTGKWFSFEHEGADVVPDMVTSAKGINGAYVPLGMVAMREHVAEHFRSQPVGVGSTYNSHPVALASAYAALKYMLRHDIVGGAARKQAVIEAEMQRLLERHESVKQARVIGMFGGFDICESRSQRSFVAKVHEPLTPAMAKFKAALMDEGLFCMMRGHQVFVIPPLITTETQLKEAFAIFDRCLDITDSALVD